MDTHVLVISIIAFNEVTNLYLFFEYPEHFTNLVSILSTRFGTRTQG